jgi:hypothetical protein
MALSKSSLKQRIITELKGQGFVTEGEHPVLRNWLQHWQTRSLMKSPKTARQSFPEEALWGTGQ